MAQQLKRISQTNLTKGYNDKDKPEDLAEGFMADILNGFCEENKIVKRNGYSAIGNAAVPKPILGQDRHEPSGGSKYILRARNNADDTFCEIEGWSGSGDFTVLTGANELTANKDVFFVSAQGATYIFNGTDPVLKTTNGTSTSEVAGIPVGSIATWFHQRLFVVNGGRLYFSDPNTPETFDAVNGYIDIDAGNNEDIAALGVLKDELLLVKPSRFWGLTGYGASDFTISDVGERITNIGSIAPRSIVTTGNDMYYLSFQGDIPHFRSVRRTKEGYLVDGGIISDNITGTMRRLVLSRIGQAAGAFDGRRVWWSVCTSGTTNNEVLVYDTLTRGWTRHTGINASVFHVSTISGVAAIYFGSSTANGKSYKLDGTKSDDGAAIDFQLVTPAYSPQPGYKTRFKYIYLTADVESDVKLTVENSPNGFSYNDLGTISLDSTGAVFGTATFSKSKFGTATIARDRLDFAGGTAYYMQYRYSNNKVNEDVAIREWEVFHQEKGLRAV